MTDDHILCPDCGWTGTEDELDTTEGVKFCPLCDTDVEFIE